MTRQDAAHRVLAALLLVASIPLYRIILERARASEGQSSKPYSTAILPEAAESPARPVGCFAERATGPLRDPRGNTRGSAARI